MSSTNISLKQEAYEYLQSIKQEDESFSDAILKLKQKHALSGKEVLNLASKHRAQHSDTYFLEREKSMAEIRNSFESRLQ